MPELITDFQSLPSEYQNVVRLAQDRHQIGVTPLQALAGGRSGAMVFLVSVSSQNPERIEHCVLKLDRKNEWSQSDEIRLHDAAVRQSPPGFAAQHLAQMAFDPIEADGALGMFYSIAGQSLHQYRTLSAYEKQSQVEAIFAHSYRYLLSDWNAARTFKQAVHPSALLEQWLSFRLKPGSHIEKFLETVCRVPPGIAGFLIQGSIFPNPLAYARSPEWWGAIRTLDATVGLQHGDLNTNNILVKFAKNGEAVEGYYLIDFALFKEQMPLVFDLRYLEMSYLLLRQSQLSFAKLADLIARFGEADTLDAQQVPIDVAGLCAIISSTRREYARWIEDYHPTLHDDLWGQFWLAGVAAGLCYCHKPGIGNEERMAGLVYAAANLKRYGALFGMPTPTRGEQLYNAAQFRSDKPVGGSSPASAGAAPDNLPAQVTAFIGRETELASIKALLSDIHNRLVTIVAPGGMGKTRLALEAAGQISQAFPQGVYFIALDRLSTADLIVQAVADVLPISLSSKEDPKSRIVDYLHDKTTLLVMDNFEHVLDGAAFVQDILGAAPRVQFLATSRAKLNLTSETLFNIDGLTVDEVSLEKNSAIQLFAQSARRMQPKFELNDAVLPAVTRICRMVGGMPLAIVLAAAWIDTLSVDEIAAEIEKSIDILETELRDVSDRQRSVRAVIESSWNQVDATAQNLLKRLAVYRGGFTRAAAQEAAGATLRGLSQLVDKALLRRDPNTGRYSIHELLRQYAEEQLVLSADEERSAHESHATYFADFMKTCGTRAHDHRLKASLLEIEDDIDNIRVAWNYWTDKQEAHRLLEFIDAMWLFFEVRGSFTPAIQFFGDAANKLVVNEPDIICARAQLRARQAWFTAQIGLPDEGLLMAQESVNTLRQYNSQDIIVETYSCVTINAIFMNKFQVVLQATQDMMARAERSGDVWERGFALVWSALLFFFKQQISEAAGAGQEALAIFERLNNPFGLSVASGIILGTISMVTGDKGAAKAHFLRGVQAAEEINFLRLLQICYDNLGNVALLENDVAQAQQFFLKSLRISQECGQTREMLASLRDLANVHIAQGNPENALQLLAVVLNHPASEQNSLNRPERLRDEAEKLRAQIETRLDPRRYRSAWEAGQKKRLAEVVTQILTYR